MKSFEGSGLLCIKKRFIGKVKVKMLHIERSMRTEQLVAAMR
jgi:hypothetical protein